MRVNFRIYFEHMNVFVDSVDLLNIVKYGFCCTCCSLHAVVYIFHLHKVAFTDLHLITVGNFSLNAFCRYHEMCGLLYYYYY